MQVGPIGRRLLSPMRQQDLMLASEALGARIETAPIGAVGAVYPRRRDGPPQAVPAVS